MLSIPAQTLLLALLLGGLAQGEEILCEGTYKGHLQGVDADADGHLFWSFTTVLLKTDATGKVLASVPVPNHHGDLACDGGKVFVAMNLGKFNQPAGRADSWVYVYSADDLSLLGTYPVPEVVHGAGGMARKGEGWLIIGGLPEGTEENYAYEYDAEFRFIEPHVIASGYTLLGIQTACRVPDGWYFGCYGKRLLRVDDSFRLTGSYPFDAAIGIIPRGDGRFLIARHFGDVKWRAKLRPYRADATKGMIPE